MDANFHGGLLMSFGLEWVLGLNEFGFGMGFRLEWVLGLEWVLDLNS